MNFAERLIPVYGTNAWNIILITDALNQQSIPDFPSEHGRVLSFVFADFFHNPRCRHFWFTSPNYSRLDASSFIIPARDERVMNVMIDVKKMKTNGENFLSYISRAKDRRKLTTILVFVFLPIGDL